MKIAGTVWEPHRTVPHDDHFLKAETEKKRKYPELTHEIVDMCDVRSAEIIPILISANSLAHHLRQLDWIRDGLLAARMQMAVLLDSARIVHRFVSLYQTQGRLISLPGHNPPPANIYLGKYRYIYYIIYLYKYLFY